MVFNSWEFFVFLVFALAGYYLVPDRYRNIFVAFSGFYFYSFWSIKFTAILVFTSVADYWLALAIDDAKNPKSKKFYLACSVVMNLGILGFFKYCNFFTENVGHFFGAIGLDVPMPVLNVVLPVGISFYTFQEMSYAIDVYRGDCRARRNYFDVAAFVVFFPQLVAGPIERASHLLGQLERPARPSGEAIAAGAQLILWGLFQKVVIADNIAPIVNYAFGARAVNDTGLALAGMYAFAIQIYCDFAGYTDIARGLGKWFGIDIMKNFNRPYLAESIRDFWTRWHISLSTWLKDYLYIPLGGSRCSPTRVKFNLLVTMLLGGLWHGASWLFLFWGLYHGLLLVFEHAFQPQAKTVSSSGWRKAARQLATFHLVCFGWVLFRAQTIEGLSAWIKSVASFSFDPAYAVCWASLLVFTAPLALVWGFELNDRSKKDVLLGAMPSWGRLVTVGFLFAMVSILSAEAGREFIYFQF